MCLILTNDKTGEGNPLLLVEPPHPYNVLAWFHITDIWSEPEINSSGLKVSFWKARFEKIILGERSWWMPKNSIPAILAPGNFTAFKVSCSVCGKLSKRIFNQGWTCLSRTCQVAWSFPSNVSYKNLTYTNNFLNERTAYTGRQPQSLIPDFPTISNRGFGTEKVYRDGIVCPRCDGCSRRIHWDRWVYETDGCDFELSYTIPEYPLSLVKKEKKALLKTQKRYRDFVGEGVLKLEPFVTSGYTMQCYLLKSPQGPLVVGSAVVFSSNAVINERENGPDDLWSSLQTKDLGLKRNPVRHAGRMCCFL
jgi:hypothetical protein